MSLFEGKIQSPEFREAFPEMKDDGDERVLRVKKLFDATVACVSNVMDETSNRVQSAELKAVVLFGSLMRGKERPSDIDFLTVIDTSRLPPPEEGNSYRSQTINYNRLSAPARLLKEKLRAATGVPGHTIMTPETRGINFIEVDQDTDDETLKRRVEKALKLNISSRSPPKPGTKLKEDDSGRRDWTLTPKPRHVVGDPAVAERITQVLEDL